jgi:predicted RecB family nuclease
MRNLITKADWLAAQQCIGMAWRQLRGQPEAPDEAERFRMEQGREVGALARKRYPNGLPAPGGSPHAAAAGTQAIVANGAGTIFEATALATPFVARADILIRAGSGWHVIEVKSSFSDTTAIEGLTDDLAYTVMVFKRSGFPIVKASLLLLSRDYCFGDGPDRLFDVVDRTAEALDRAAEFSARAGSCATALMREDPPDPKLGPVCRQCSAFGDECLGAAVSHTVLEIPGLHYKKLQELGSRGIVDLSELPDDVKLNERQRRFVTAAVSGRLVVEDGLGEALATLKWPCYYLDFETVATVLPLYDGHGCHQQVLTQFSAHSRDGIGGELRHTEFLADAGRDCQRELALSLIDALGTHGSVVVYSSFEKTRIKGLVDRFADLGAPLQAILDRLWDLHPVVADYVSHPEFHGSFSIKKVLPVLVPELSYDGLSIHNGELAIARFARMARGEITGEAVQTTRRQLLEYCKLDTLAMVRLHDALADLAAGRISERA